jgi:alkylation response protein AidB-like acyl-CoA dehydrogenase
MKTPGITVRPIITLDGGHEVNDVFLDNVKVPVENRIFEENKGWTCAKFLLATSAPASPGSRAPSAASSGCAAWPRPSWATTAAPARDPFFKRKVAELEIDLTALEYTELRTLAGEAPARGRGRNPRCSRSRAPRSSSG